ncbi:hypothetical protein K6Y31_13240 [Motilimonas cestriensis]|uniref:Competence protein CoiA-like N-terminal domain-containing protein n=1 Tax=Motilimonas cestriensis TaxID=2742685 RepID=A0ABS8WBW7_9GAMM|nr:hypothetical protein [Motilimonas cestriensis]MCE2595770.1 hypothetical protein [Motilimonas cestriensis]
MSVLIPFALDHASNEMVFVEDVPRGAACGCVCYACKTPVIAKKGNIKQHHFAHEKGKAAALCEINLQRSLFWMSRNLFTSHQTFVTPDYDYQFSCDLGCQTATYPITKSAKVNYQQVTIPRTKITKGADVIVLEVGDYQLAVILNFLGHSYTHGYQGLPTVQINMQPLISIINEHQQNPKSAIINHLLVTTNNKKWLYHPRQKVFEDKCQALHQAQQEQALKIEKTRQQQQETQRQQAQAAALERAQQRQLEMAADLALKRQQQAQYEQAERQAQQAAIATAANKTKQRRASIVASVNAVKALGHQEAWLCERCKFARPPNDDNCHYCGGQDYKVISLSDAELALIDRKFYQWNYAELSCEVLPNEVRLVSSKPS